MTHEKLKGRGMDLCFDTEANNLLEKVTKVWCVVAQDPATMRMYVYHDFPQYNGAEVYDAFDKETYIIPKRDGTLEEGIKFLMNAGGKLIAHNTLGYDHFLMKKFFPWYTVKLSRYHDTFIQSKLQWFDRPTPKGCKGPHGLQAWGARQGIMKPEVKDWSEMDAFKLHRCIQDVKIQTKTYEMLQKERERLEEVTNSSLAEALGHDHKYRFEATLQELRGAPVDVEHMKACVKELDELTEELRNKIEPLLPPTLKVKAPRATATDVATLLGAKRIPPVQYERVKRAGEEKLQAIKKYYKPVMKWLTTKKGKMYSAVHEDMEIDTGHIFPKMKDARDWVKEIHPALKKGWKFPSIEAESYTYNANTCKHFGVEPMDYNANDVFQIVGPHTKVEFLDSKMSQHAVVKQYLLSLGWVPTEWNFKKDAKGGLERDSRGKLIPTTPKLTEDSFDSIEGDGVGRDIANFNTYSHRRKFIQNPTDTTKGLLNRVREDGRVSCGINSFGTATGRSSHSNWVNAPGVGALYGEKVRQCIRAEEGKVLVGADMKSAQLSIAAYYANNYDYYMAVADGQEVRMEGDKEIYIGESGHCVNARMFELVTEEEWKEAIATQDPDLLHSIMLRRKKSKGGTFATIFGASGKKIGTTLGIPESLGEEKKQAFLTNIGLDEPIRRLELMMEKYKRGRGGYIELPFGYWVFCSQKHKLFNYLDQGTEAICQKLAVIHFESKLRKEIKAGNMDAEKIIDYHDEFLVQSHPDCAKEVGQLMCDSYKKVSDDCLEWHLTKSQWFNDLTFAFNLDGGYKIGKDYLEVH